MTKINFSKSLLVFVLLNLAIFVSGCGEGTTPEKILAKYAEATGENKIAKPKSMFFKAKVTEMPTNLGVTSPSGPASTQPFVRMTGMTLYCEFPNKIYLSSDAALIVPHQFGESKAADVKLIRVYDGKTGWEIINSPTGNSAPRELLFYEVDKLKKITESTSPGNTLAKINKTKYLGEQNIRVNVMSQGTGMLVDKKVHVVEAFSPEGKKQTLYFDAENWFLLKIEEVDPLTNDKISTTFDNYKDYGNLKLASSIRMNKTSNNNQPSEDIILDVEEFNFDAPEPTGAFVKPAF